MLLIVPNGDAKFPGIRSNKKMLLLVGGLPPGPDRLPSNLVQYYDDEKKTWKILTTYKKAVQET
ncbi:hypothetical protein MC885_008128 [Smutsia gigantea]|nr:hypothetical protein MC885_008128 [Smutsia gigantea]